MSYILKVNVNVKKYMGKIVISLFYFVLKRFMLFFFFEDSHHRRKTKTI